MNINSNSLKSVRIESFSKETSKYLASASGFICEYEKRWFLVTNWHVLSGKNFETSEIIHRQAAIPGTINISFIATKDFISDKAELRYCTIKNIQLYKVEIKDDQPFIGEEPLWFEHPEMGSSVDVAILEISDRISMVSNIETIGYKIPDECGESQNLNVMDEVYLIGYPLRSSTTPNQLPIYKSASIASEPNIFDDRPIFYVDGKTKKGMSGSAVIKRSRVMVDQPKGLLFRLKEGGLNLIGIYSGRERAAQDEYEAELGIVWRFHECVIPILAKACEKSVYDNSSSEINF